MKIIIQIGKSSIERDATEEELMNFAEAGHEAALEEITGEAEEEGEDTIGGGDTTEGGIGMVPVPVEEAKPELRLVDLRDDDLIRS